MADHYTNEGVGFVDATREDAVEEARKRHHLATADPDLEDTMTGPAHEEKYGLERAAGSKAIWEAAGLHPINNGPLDAGPAGPAFETTEAPSAKK
jgi:hypothetical protein